MKRPAQALLVIISLALTLATPAHAGVQDFTFDSFDADYTLTRDAQRIGRLHVVERLVAVFPDVDQNHGIVRAIPQSYQGHSVHLKVAGVKDAAGAAIPYSRSTSNGHLLLQIGRAEQYVHGRQTYVITYDMDNVTAAPGGYDGLFWDVNGDQWQQPFGTVTATVHLDPALVAVRDATHDRCFTGARGSTQQNCTLSAGADGIKVTATALTPGQTLTYELGFQPGTFAAYTIPAAELYSLIAQVAGLLVLPIALALWFAVRRWWRFGRDPAGRGTVVPEYSPPRHLSVLAASAILHEGFRSSAITATILDLAVRRYLKIYETSQRALIGHTKTYELELTQPPATLTGEEQSVITMLFGVNAAPGARVNISNLANKLSEEADTLGKTVNQGVTAAGYFTTTPEKAKATCYILGAILVVAGLACYWLPLLLAGLVLAGVVLLVAANVMPARTAAGVAVRDHLLGLKHFIALTEADRIKMMQSPQGELTEKIDINDTTQLVKVYERLLPYAMLFGIEKIWLHKFAALYQNPPDWYHGSGAFNAVAFSNTLSGFSQASGASFTAPSSSGSGGFAGGGGGGGGGGGW